MGVVEITEFIEPYKKIRNLRLKHKLTQKDIAGDIYSQTYITMIENGKFPLTKQFIKHFIAIINTKESVRLKIKDFRYDVKEHIQKSLDEKLAEIKSTEYCLTSYKNFEEMVMKNINQLSLTNFFFFITEIGKIYYHNSEIEMAKNSFYRLLSFSGNITDNDLLAEYLLYLTRIVFAFEQFKMIEDFEIIIDKNINTFKNDIKEKIYCNVITINFRADKYEKALEISEKYKKNVAFKRIPREIDMIVALCYKSLGEIEKALKTYQKVNRYDKKEETKIWVNMNIMEIYKELGDIAAVEYRFKILRNIFNGKKIEAFSAYEKNTIENN